MSQANTDQTNLPRIYNHGDMANVPHFGTIIKTVTDQWGTHVTIRSDAQVSEFGPEFSVESFDYTVPASMVGNVFKGNGLTRIVTEEAYQTWRENELKKLRNSIREGA